MCVKIVLGKSVQLKLTDAWRKPSQQRVGGVPWVSKPSWWDLMGHLCGHGTDTPFPKKLGLSTHGIHPAGLEKGETKSQM